MIKRGIVAVAFLLSATPLLIAGELKLPKEVTPALRAACETDVRRLCFGPNPTVAKVKSCVMEKFMQLGTRCQFSIASAGLM